MTKTRAYESRGMPSGFPRRRTELKSLSPPVKHLLNTLMSLRTLTIYSIHRRAIYPSLDTNLLNDVSVPIRVLTIGKDTRHMTWR
jgi:hypothetical protein